MSDPHPGDRVAVLGLAILGAVLGYGLGALCGAAWVSVMNTRSFEGSGFAPAGAVISALVVPTLYLIRRIVQARRAACGSTPGALGRTVDIKN